MPQTQICRGVKTSVVCTNGRISVVYHNTLVVEATPDYITLNTGGWFTATTRTRMNQASNQFDLGYGVYQKKGKWFVDYQGNTYPFDRNEIRLNRVTGDADYKLFVESKPVTCENCSGVGQHEVNCYSLSN